MDPAMDELPADQETPEQRLAAIQAQGQTPEQRLAAIQQQPTGDQKAHADFKSGALQRRNQILNKNDLGAANESNPSYMDRFGSMAERGATTLGGGKVLQAMRAAITGEPWSVAGQNVANDVEEAGQNAPGVTIPKALPLIGGSRVTLADVPAAMLGFRSLLRAGAGPVVAGGVSAGVPRAMSPAPESLQERGVGTLKATALGMAVPAVLKGTEFAGRWKAASDAPTLDENLVARGGAPGVSGGARGAAASPLYEDFRNGPDLPMTPTLQRILDLPIARRALRTVQGESADLNGLPPTNPNVLDAVYKRIGNKAWTAQQGFEAGATTDALKGAIDEAATQNGSPLYSPGVDMFAEHSAGMDAVGRGNRAMQYAASPRGAPLGAIEDSPAAFKEWAGQPERTPADMQGAREGVLARLKVEPKTAKFGIGKLSVPVGPSQAMSAAPELLGQVGQAPSALQRALQAATQDKSWTVGETPRNLLEWMKSRVVSDAPPEAPTAAPTASARALPQGQYDVGNGVLRALSQPREQLSLPRNQSAVPTAGEGPVGPAIPMRPVPPTDAEMFGSRIPPSRQLTRGPLTTPKPMPGSAEELSRFLNDPELRRRLGLSP